jgi:hypothetical protein
VQCGGWRCSRCCIFAWENFMEDAAQDTHGTFLVIAYGYCLAM